MLEQRNREGSIVRSRDDNRESGVKFVFGEQEDKRQRSLMKHRH